MGSLNLQLSTPRLRFSSNFHSNLAIPSCTLISPVRFPSSIAPRSSAVALVSAVKSQSPTSGSNGTTAENEEEEEEFVQDLTVPENWLLPSKASEESEWLRVALHKWLDDEYCPEETNIDISKVAANSYYRSLLEKRTDLGEILLKMARDLESISYQDSFHGAFSSANAAIELIVRRIEQL